jgi:hypothetical protein
MVKQMKLSSQAKSVILGIVPMVLTLAPQPIVLADLPLEPLPAPNINSTTPVKFICPLKVLLAAGMDIVAHKLQVLKLRTQLVRQFMQSQMA